MKKVILTKGLPASGKTTWALELIKDNPNQYKRINKDDLRSMLDGGKWSPDSEKFILKVRDSLVLLALESGKHVVIDDTNLHHKHEDQIRQLVKGKAEVEIKDFTDIDIETCIKRDLLRPHSVGEKIIRGMYNQFLKPKAQVYIPPEYKPCAYIFDIDGTLAHMGNRSPFDWDKVGEDEVNPIIRDILLSLKRENNKIIIFTGRDGVCEKETKEWLAKHHITYDYFDIRPEGNTEKDSIVKTRMFEKIKDDYNIRGVFDDRNQVVSMWRSLGLTCLQVAEGDF